MPQQPRHGFGTYDGPPPAGPYPDPEAPTGTNYRPVWQARDPEDDDNFGTYGGRKLPRIPAFGVFYRFG